MTTRDAKREATAHRITVAARQLAADQGYDEFTLDELADTAGVSRRTLFNYFPSKLDAVMGQMPSFDDAVIDEFCSGGPSGDLMTDVMGLAVKVTEAKDTPAAEWRTAQLCFERNPKLIAAATARFAEISTAVQSIIAQREGTQVDAARNRVCAGVLFTLFKLSTDEFAAGSPDRLATIVSRNAAAARQLYTQEE